MLMLSCILQQNVISSWRITIVLCIRLEVITHMMSNTVLYLSCFFFSSRRRHTRFDCDWSSDVCSSDLATAEGLLLVAKNQLDRGRIDVTRALGLDPATPLAFSDSLAPSLGAADVPAQRDSGLAAALANRPELRAELARAAAARQTGSAIRAERLPRLELAGDYGVDGQTVPKAIATRGLALQG